MTTGRVDLNRAPLGGLTSLCPALDDYLLGGLGLSLAG
jgi:hypothetical protein